MRARTIAIFVLLGTIGISAIVTAQAFLYPVQVSDFKANGTALGYFNKQPSVHSWNFTGVSTPSISGTTMTVPEPIYGTSDLGTCGSSNRGVVTILENPSTTDGGVDDVTYQCCRLRGLTYSWTSHACN